ncbi:hypothetical protein MASR2M29_03620 [Spirochaetota bacterium]
MDSLNYRELYLLQDGVLKTVFETEREFYLTGGTCLSRFYVEKRYSDDLDFFTNQSPRYGFAVKNIKKALMKSFHVRAEVESKDFTRLTVNSVLQVDFVNDLLFYYKEPIVNENNYIIDNIENILSNKISAIIGRDNPKDVFDIYLIYTFYTIKWQEILEAAHKKCSFADEELIIRLKSFPANLLKSIKLADPEFLNNFEEEFPLLLKKIKSAVS